MQCKNPSYTYSNKKMNNKLNYFSTFCYFLIHTLWGNIVKWDIYKAEGIYKRGALNKNLTS